MRRSLREAFAAVLGASALLCSPLPSQAEQYVGVARLSVATGSVSIRQAGSNEATAGVVNAPVTAGDYVLTGDASRAEVQIDDANFIRASEDVQLRFTRMDENEHTLQLATGTIELSILKATDGRPSVQTPSITIMPADAGIYRITVTKDGTTLLTVRSGRAELLSAGGSQTIQEGVSVSISGSSNNPIIRNIQTIAYDDFDEWNTERDKLAWRAYAMTDYASSEITGLADLSSYGHWNYAPQYGYVWSPYNQSNWSPYANGRWAWAQPIGWTWVGYEPWGWAPYHYGRWFYAPAFGWAWYPGPLYAQYFWQPCLVAFFGFGLGGGFNFAVGNLGWVPLAPYEPYYPLYPFNSVNVVQVNNPLKMWSNARAPGGITAITGNSLTNGKYRYVHMAANDLHDVVATRGALPIAPTGAALRYTQDAGTRDVALSPRFAAMPAPRPVPSFAQQRDLAASQVNAAIHQATTIVHQPAARSAGDTVHQPKSASHQANAPQNPWTLFESTQFESKPQPASQLHGQIDTSTKDVDPWSRFITGDHPTSGAQSPTYLSKMPGIVHPLPMSGLWPALHSGAPPNTWNIRGSGLPGLPPAPALPAGPAVPPPPAPAPAPAGGHGNH